MKKSIQIFGVLVLMINGTQAYSQKYKTADDTIRLNKEYVKVSNDIAELNAKLIIAQNNLSGYKSKAINADTDAKDAAANSSDQASKAINGSVRDAKKAKRKAKKAYGEAKDSRSANENLSDHESKITKLTLQINKKQQRIQELDLMRRGIEEKLKL